ncbi:formyltransferase family protein [Bosea sp. ANAM02]|uniref:methionyl-tRNA formyltransferase n=1 Tax=Bosea sp. ANAM02 TaxID=2020412 RepID=UPI00140E9A3F|nr:formyltransferase family protein [Bosea sp. ANAM02]BCB21371.1 formyl transferase [Bosea sp. ANAM02]
MRVAVLGRTHWLLDSAEQLAGLGHAIALVATAPAAPEYRVREEDFTALASRHNAPFHNGPDVNDAKFIDALAASGAQVAISVNWPTLIRKSACTTPRFGILNAHAGDLPRYRGNACPNWAILNDERHIGLCVHAMDPDALDAGPIYARERFELAPDTYIGDVYAWMDAAVPGLFARAIENLTRSGFAPEEQSADGMRPLRSYPRRPEDGLIDWHSDAASILRLVRASSHPFAGAFTYLEGQERAVIWRARLAEMDHEIAAVPGQILGRSANGRPLVACQSGVIEIEESETASGRPLPRANRYRLTARRRTE